MTKVSIWQRLKRSLVTSAGTIVFGMEDGTVSIFGLIFGVAATTTNNHTVLIAGASGAAAAAVSMMAGAYLDTETSRDAQKASRARLRGDLKHDPASIGALLQKQLAASALNPKLSAALAGAVKGNPEAGKALLFALQSAPEAQPNPREQARWMLLADFLSAAVPILPFVFLSVPQARVVSAAVTTVLLVVLGIGRARIADQSVIRTVVETVSVGVTAALAGVAISVLLDRSFSG